MRPRLERRVIPVRTRLVWSNSTGGIRIYVSRNGDASKLSSVLTLAVSSETSRNQTSPVSLWEVRFEWWERLDIISEG